MFDESRRLLALYLEDKFRRDNIRMLKGRYVREVFPRELWTNSRKTGECVKVPFGLCVWATGLGINAFTRQLQDRLGGGGKGKVERQVCPLELKAPSFSKLPRKSLGTWDASRP